MIVINRKLFEMPSGRGSGRRWVTALGYSSMVEASENLTTCKLFEKYLTVIGSIPIIPLLRTTKIGKLFDPCLGGKF